MPNNDLKRMASAEKIYDCPYLFPKKFLLPLGISTRKNQAVVALGVIMVTRILRVKKPFILPILCHFGTKIQGGS